MIPKLPFALKFVDNTGQKNHHLPEAEILQ